MTTERKDLEVCFGAQSIANYSIGAQTIANYEFNSGYSLTGSTVNLNRCLDNANPNLTNIYQVVAAILFDRHEKGKA